MLLSRIDKDTPDDVIGWWKLFANEFGGTGFTMPEFLGKTQLAINDWEGHARFKGCFGTTSKKKIDSSAPKSESLSNTALLNLSFDYVKGKAVRCSEVVDSYRDSYYDFSLPQRYNPTLSRFDLL